MKPAEMENIIHMLIGQAEEELTALTNLQSDFYFNQEMKNDLLENMSRRPKYTNYLQMKDVINNITYVALKRIMVIYSLKKNTETTIQELKKLLKTLPEDDQPYID
ncbi:unnamed protein product [Lactuca saligna]|uniref:Uncharacterized protein n=1 Tax=Lactuca saligna TaxID=75948 RepID=A0AA35YW54_LACSI|nr:unnamed protein product [Lactuca saligna]